MFKEVNAETRSVLSSGKSSLMSTVLTLLVHITEILIFNLKELTFITTKPPVEDMSQEQSLWILNPEQWTPLELVPSVNSSDLTTLSSDSLEQETTGLKATILKELN